MHATDDPLMSDRSPSADRSEPRPSAVSASAIDEVPGIRVENTDRLRLFPAWQGADVLILSQLRDAVLVSDGEYRILYANPAFERIFGWKPAQAIGQHATFRFPPHVRSEVEGYLAEVILGKSFAKEWQDFRADGSRVWIHWRCERLLDADGHVIGTVNIGTDISDRKQAEVEREELQQQLFQAQRLDTLGTLAGGIAHDFNNILAVILGFTELAMSRCAPDESMRHMHEQVVVATKRGRDLVSRILSFSRFHHPERRAIDVGEVVADGVKFIRATLPSTVNVETNLPASCPPTLADPHQLHQVLLNLATNASHAMRDHHGTLTLALEARDVQTARSVATGVIAPGKYLVISATDTGCGMDSATLQRVFEPFFTTKKEGEGTGLGLSVVRAIVEGHGGALDVASEPGKGSRFCIYLPVVSGVTMPAVSTEEAFAPRLRARGETIAVIDDEHAMASVTERVLQSFGYTTLSFASAEKFHAAYLTAPAGIDLVVTDQTMPGMTGFEMARRLRDAGHTLPILLMTGFSKQLRSEMVAQLGRATLLRKPFDRTTLGRAVRDLLDEAAGHD